MLVLCSDGLTSTSRTTRSRRAPPRRGTLEEACERLIALANARGGEDNITVASCAATGRKRSVRRERSEPQASEEREIARPASPSEA